jgi:hypothetical protein
MSDLNKHKDIIYKLMRNFQLYEVREYVKIYETPEWYLDRELGMLGGMNKLSLDKELCLKGFFAGCRLFSRRYETQNRFIAMQENYHLLKEIEK